MYYENKYYDFFFIYIEESLSCNRLYKKYEIIWNKKKSKDRKNNDSLEKLIIIHLIRLFWM